MTTATLRRLWHWLIGDPSRGAMLGKSGPKLGSRRKQRKYEARVVDDGEVLSEWLPAKRLKTGEFKLSGDPNWDGAILHVRDLEVREVSP